MNWILESVTVNSKQNRTVKQIPQNVFEMCTFQIKQNKKNIFIFLML